MKQKYTNDRSTQIVLSVLKANKIRKVIASPGTTNIALVASMQQDPFFEIYSSVDERSAAYMACGLAEESGEPVVLSCTGATASRNYMPGLTEAYYRKLPILAITGSHGDYRIGHLNAQVMDRSVTPHDIVRYSVSIPTTHNATDEWINTVNANKAVLELFRDGGGPVHINLEASHDRNYSVEELPYCRIIRRIYPYSIYPELPHGRIALFIGSHKPFTEAETQKIDSFCETNDAAVFCDYTSGYKGKYAVHFALVATQQNYRSPLCNVDLLIHLGEVSGDFYETSRLNAKQVWRVSEDGEIRDTFKSLSCVFEMRPLDFFEKYINESTNIKTDYYDACQMELKQMRDSFPIVGFSNIWIAQQLYNRIPSGSTLHFSIFNSLRSWNFFEIPIGIRTNCNVGGFGIDGPMSTLLGAALSNQEKLYFGIIGDLAFFYDLNSLGNRHVPSNLRILLINNGRGIEFRNLDHLGAAFGDDADAYIAAAGHFANKSHELVMHYATDLGFRYISASNKEEFLTVYQSFVEGEIEDCPVIFEVFTNTEDEREALNAVRNIIPSSMKEEIKHTIKDAAKKIVGEQVLHAAKNILKK